MTAREFAGPLRAKSRRGPIGETWWSRTFVSLLEASSIGGRLQRGKNYARQGRVLTMAIEPGQVTALVQGSEPDPYEVILSLEVFGSEDVALLGEQIARAPFLVAALAAGTLPEELDQVAQRLELRLLPAGPSDLRFSCTCPDWGEPCKHASAVTYLLAEHLDTEPFDLLTLHGVDRGELIEQVLAANEALGGTAGRGAASATAASGPAAATSSGAPGTHPGSPGGAAGTGEDASPQGAGPLESSETQLERAERAATGFFAAPAPFPLPARPEGDASALAVLDHSIITPRGPSITYWLTPHYERLAATGKHDGREARQAGERVG